MRAFALELLEWWNARLHAVAMAEFDLDRLDIDLLCQGRDHATTEEAATDLGITLSRAKSRYEKLNRKLQATCKRSAVDKAIALGLIQPAP